MANRSSDKQRNAHSQGGVRALPAPKEVTQTIQYGDFCYQAERYGDALEAYHNALSNKSHLDQDEQARLHYRLANCYLDKDLHSKALFHLDQARNLLPRHLDKVRLAQIYHRRGRIMRETGRYQRALRYYSWAHKMLRGTNQHEEHAFVEMGMGIVYHRLGNTNKARDCALNALGTFRRIDHVRGESSALNNLALFLKSQGNLREAVRCFIQTRDISKTQGFRNRLMSVYLNLGIVYYKLSEWDSCLQSLDHAERLALELSVRQTYVRVLLAQGNLAMRRQSLAEAGALYKKAGQEAEAGGYERECILVQEFQAELDCIQGKAGKAYRSLKTAIKRGHESAPAGDVVYELTRVLADVCYAQEKYDKAMAYASEARDMAQNSSDLYEELLSQRVLGLAQVASGDAEGHDNVKECLEGIARMGDDYQVGLTHLQYGRLVAAEAGESRLMPLSELASSHLQRAHGVFLDIDIPSLAGWACFERAKLEASFGRIDEATSFRGKCSQASPVGTDSKLDAALQKLAVSLEDKFAEEWSHSGDILLSLSEIKSLFQGESNSDTALAELLRLAVTQTRSSRGMLVRLDNGVLNVVGTHNCDLAEAEQLVVDLKDSLEQAALEKRPVWASDAAADERLERVSREPHRVTSLVALPISLAPDQYGVLYVDKRDVDKRDSAAPGYHQGEIQLLTVLANLTALSIAERKTQDLLRENEELKKKIAQVGGSKFITVNSKLQETLRWLDKVADSPISVLLSGETGTGKSLLAEMIHESSKRQGKPFVQINCAALPEQLLESELFGHVKGAFTGATSDKVGLFKEADGGTLFLDEVDKTSLTFQSKLLHVMDRKFFRPVGALTPVQVDTRVVCATNTNLRERIERKEFLEDLYYRLNDFTLSIPPLRERPEDIPLLIEHFVKKFTVQFEKENLRLSPQVHRLLSELPWPGNVRELEKTIRRMVVLSDGENILGIELLPSELQQAVQESNSGTLKEAVARAERRIIAEALQATGGNKLSASRMIKLSYPSMLKKIKEYGLQ